MKILITGAGGFVGPYLKKELIKHQYKVFGTDLKGNEDFICDITNYKEVLTTISKVNPDIIIHLAGFTSVSESFKKTELCNKINIEGTQNLISAIKNLQLDPLILIISSAEVYGPNPQNPINENHSINPISPYAKSKLEQERIALNSGLKVIISRSFNHTGPTQPSNFVIPYFKEQIMRANSGDYIKCGNLDVIRDFSKVEDIVKGYRILIEKGNPGEIYNMGSGIGHSLKDILNLLIFESGKKLNIEIDKTKFRPTDIQIQIADTTKIKQLGINIPSAFKNL